MKTITGWWRRMRTPEPNTWQRPLPRGPVTFDLSLCARASLMPVPVRREPHPRRAA